jgi:hypothetical protein
VEFFFDAVYALVVFLACAAIAVVPACVLTLVLPRFQRVFMPVGIVLAGLGWVWLGWIEGTYGISRLGLVLFALVGAVGFVQGWALGLRLGAEVRGRHATR